jgi:hypothetical protein
VGEQPHSLDIDPTPTIRFKIEHRGSYVRIFALANLTFTVKVPNGLGECSEYVWMVFAQDVVDMMSRDDVRLAALQCPRDAKQTNKVAIVSMKELPRESA